MKKGAVYIRVSTHEQLEFSPDAQKAAIFEYAKRNNILIDNKHVFVDEGISGRKAEKRPEFMRMINHAKKKPRPFDFILVHRFDRFSRNREDSVVYKSLLKKEYGIKVISITEQIENDKFAVILESMLEAMAEYYSLNLADEVKKGMREKARRGGFQGSPPYGYRIENKGGIPIIVEEEAKVIKIIYDKFLKEKKSYREIAAYLNHLSHRTKKGNPFESRGIKYILQNSFYYGEIRWNYKTHSKLNDKEDWIIAKGSHAPIIEKKVWDNAKHRIKILEQTNIKNAKPCRWYRHWLSGIMKCSYCGGTMTYTIIKDKYEYFRCNKHLKGSCSKANYVTAKEIEKAIVHKIQKDMMDIELVICNINKNEENGLNRLKKQLKSVRLKYELAAEAYLNKVDTLDEYENNKKKIELEEKKLLEYKLGIELSDYQKALLEKKLQVYQLLNFIKDEKRTESLNAFIKSIRVNAYKKNCEIEYYIEY